MSAQKGLVLQVTRGPDAGARVIVESSNTVGRSREANLVLSDPNVSRSHFQIIARERGAHLVVNAGAAPVVLGDKPVQQADLAVGDAVMVGNTVLVLAEQDIPESDPQPAGERGNTTIQTLMSGVAADVRGLAAVFALDGALSSAHDEESLMQAMSAWSRSYAECDGVQLREVAPEVGEEKRPDDRLVVESAADDGRATVTVPVAGARFGAITFVTKLPPDRISDSLRRLFVVAGAVFASSLGRVRAVAAAESDRDSMRGLAIGGARVFSGTSPAAQEVAQILPRIASSNVTVLLLGETGVGKSFVARLIHESGPRGKEPLRIINCAAVPENLVESELFGHERGAFSGAVAAREGALQAAGRGTVLLDEIGEMPLASQAKLLRVLEERRFERIGSNRSIPLHARVITATNRDLGEMVAAGQFRQDLFFRISVVVLRVPALRERAGDLAMLAEQILADLAPASGRRIDGFSTEALDVIRGYSWPGNVRELRNAIEHAACLGEGRLIQPSDFPASVRDLSPTQQGDDPSIVKLPAPLEWLEQRAIEAALRATAGNRTRAAALLGVKPAVLYYKLRQGSSPE
jgi:DNA-binding NtrC family response regulator